jgi:hypothetical protein
MKKISLLLIAIIILFALTACSEKDDNPTDVQVQGIRLEHFVSKALVADSVDATVADSTDLRGLFAYEIVSGEDGFSPRQSSYAGYDINWNTFKQGFLVPDDNNKTWFSNPNLPGAFKVRQAKYFRLYRKIDVIPSGFPPTLVELKGLQIHTISNWDGNPEPAIKLSDLLQGIASYDSVCIVCYDDYGLGKYYHPDAINDGYYLLETERTIFPTAGIPNNMKKMKKVDRIMVYGPTSSQVHDFALAPVESADMIFTVPSDLTGFSTEVLPDYPQ